MKYENAQNILPEYIVQLIQEYIEGGYLYIPIKYDNKKVWGENTATKDILKKETEKFLINIMKECLLKDLRRSIIFLNIV